MLSPSSNCIIMRKLSQDIFSQTWEREQSSPAALPYPRQVSQGFPSPLVPNYFKCVIMIFIKYTNILWFTSSSRFPFPFGSKVFQFEMESLTVINQCDWLFFLHLGFQENFECFKIQLLYQTYRLLLPHDSNSTNLENIRLWEIVQNFKPPKPSNSKQQNWFWEIIKNFKTPKSSNWTIFSW